MKKKNCEKEGKIEGIIFINRGQIEGILKGKRGPNPLSYIKGLKSPDIPKHRLPSKYSIVETPAGIT